MLSFLLSFCYTKVCLKTKKMTSISQAQAGFKANSRRNPLWISRLFNAKASCACRNRLNFRLFRYTPVPVAAMQHHIRASSSAGQSWRLITAWSRVQVLPGPYRKKTPFRVSFCISGSFTPHPLRAAGSTGGSRRPAFPAAGRGCPLPRCPPRPAQGYGRSP